MRVLSGVAVSQVDSERFGRRIARGSAASSSQVDEMVGWCRSQHVDMLILRVPADRLEASHAAEALGGRICDTLVYYQKATAARPLTRSVRAAMPEDEDEVGAIAASAFRDYDSHYRADPRLSREDIEPIYEAWARSLVRQPKASARVLLAEETGRVGGFLAWELQDSGTGEILLNAVHPELAGRGLYRLLLGAVLGEMHDSGATSCVVSTQLTNRRVQAIWSSEGFRLTTSFHTFHLWL